LITEGDIVKPESPLDNKRLPRLGTPAFLWPGSSRKEVFWMTRIKSLLLALGVFALAAFNGSTPWGP